MTDQEIAGLGPAFASYLGRFRGCLAQERTAAHFDTYCRGLLSDLPRKTVEPIALAAGSAVRTLQEFPVTARWDHDQARDGLQRHLVAANKPFTLMAYPNRTHALAEGKGTRRHLFELLTRYLHEHLPPGGK
jgi:SRSO17 transposase